MGWGGRCVVVFGGATTLHGRMLAANGESRARPGAEVLAQFLGVGDAFLGRAGCGEQMARNTFCLMPRV